MTAPLPGEALRNLGREAAMAGRSDDPATDRLGKYRLIRKLAGGAMGVVWEAEDAELRRTVAVKILRESLGSSDTLRHRFRREAQAAANLSHPNLVKVYDAGEEAGRMFLVMELVRGRPLSEILGERRHDVRSMLRLLEKAARGVGAAHEAGIVHRDLKPANILVTGEGEPKVGDFGLAHWMDADTVLTRGGTPLGTPMYMSPEQVRGGGAGITPATDVYGLGVILYEILTGRPPFIGDEAAQIYTQILSEDPATPRSINRSVDIEAQTICLKALEPEPERRYPDARQFADDLKRHLAGESILARPPGPVSAGVKWAKRHRTVSVGLAIALACITVFAGILIEAAQRRHAEVADLLERGREKVIEVGHGMEQLDEDRVVERTLAAASAPEDPDKKPLWEVQRRIATRMAEAPERFMAAVTALSRVLALDPGNAEADALLAGLYVGDMERAEARGDFDAAKKSEQSAAIHDVHGAFAGRLDRRGFLSIDSVPPGAKVELRRYQLADDLRLLDVSVKELGTTPVPKTALEMGSYLLVLSKDGYREVRYPLLVGRGTRRTEIIPLYTEAEIGDGFVYVPGGPFVTGEAESRRAEVVEGFFISRHEVAAQDYADFLHAQLESEGREAAQARAPRMSNSGPYDWTLPSKATIPPKPSDPAWRVAGISWEDAEAFCRWKCTVAAGRGERVRYRLPTGLEWEKAARGADGRAYPWGDRFDFSFTYGGLSTPPGSDQKIWREYPKDESPCGVRDMAGSRSEYCAEWFDERLGLRLFRGGSRTLGQAAEFRSTNRYGIAPTAPTGNVGFRVVREPLKEH